MIAKSLDTETTGVDLHHGAMPFLVTTCNEEGFNRFWEWDVDPLTRLPIIPDGDLYEVEQEIRETDILVLQNPKFDFQALKALEQLDGQDWLPWEWEKVVDCLLAGHLLASNQPHDLTTMALIYLSINIQPYEDAVELAVKEAQKIARLSYPEWKLAKKGHEDMPSAKEKTWKFDMWLPKAIAKAEGYADDHPWQTVTAEYANADSAVTLPLYKAQLERIQERGLESIYRERLKVLPIAYAMEQKGITLSGMRLSELRTQYIEESEKAGRLCKNIAASYGYDLTLPKSGNNKSLTQFIFGTPIEDEAGKTTLDTSKSLGLKPLKVSKKTGEASLDKNVIEAYESLLPERSKALLFVRALRGKRKRDTALSYMEGYERFWRPWIPVGDVDPLTGAGWYVLHPSLNPTGTDTLRWSSSNPNEQNISKQEGFNLRYMFGPAPGREWWSCDAKNIELRLPAYESGERELIDLFERPDEAPYYGSTHLLNFHTVYGDIWEKELRAVGLEKVGPHCKKKYASTNYQWCKNGGFAVQYGAIDFEGGGGTADKAFHRIGAHAKLKERFSRLESLNAKCIAQAEEFGYVETMPDKTVNPKHGYPLLCTRTGYGKILPTVPLNYHVQGSAMWWMMKAMIRCFDYLNDLNKRYPSAGGYYMAMQVHDELVFDFPKSKGFLEDGKPSNYGHIEHLKELMAMGGDDLGVPTPVSCEYHPENWSEGISV